MDKVKYLEENEYTKKDLVRLLDGIDDDTPILVSDFCSVYDKNEISVKDIEVLDADKIEEISKDCIYSREIGEEKSLRDILKKELEDEYEDEDKLNAKLDELCDKYKDKEKWVKYKCVSLDGKDAVRYTDRLIECNEELEDMMHEILDSCNKTAKKCSKLVKEYKELKRECRGWVIASFVQFSILCGLLCGYIMTLIVNS